MRKKKKGSTSDSLDTAVYGEDEKNDFARKAADAAAFAQTLADLEGDEETEEPVLDGDNEIDGDREAADDEELEGLDERAPGLVITPQDICKGILALEKVIYALLFTRGLLTHLYRFSKSRTRPLTTPTSAPNLLPSLARRTSIAKSSCARSRRAGTQSRRSSSAVFRCARSLHSYVT